MSFNHPTKVWSKKDIDRMLEVMSVILAPGFEFAVWPEPQSEIIDGRPVYKIAYPDYHPVVDKFWKLCYETTAYVQPYAALPEDPPETDPTRGRFPPSSTEDMESATLGQVSFCESRASDDPICCSRLLMCCIFDKA